MKVVILSDTHGRLHALEPIVLREKPDALIHLGDHFEDSFSVEALFPGLPVYAVCGNNDEPLGPYHRVVAFGKTRIFLTHGHLFSLHKGIGRLASEARKNGCQAALFGHTHTALMRVHKGILVLNPGSVSLPRDGSGGSYLVLWLGEGQMSASLRSVRTRKKGESSCY